MFNNFTSPQQSGMNPLAYLQSIPPQTLVNLLQQYLPYFNQNLSSLGVNLALTQTQPQQTQQLPQAPQPSADFNKLIETINSLNVKIENMDSKIGTLEKQWTT